MSLDQNSPGEIFSEINQLAFGIVQFNMAKNFILRILFACCLSSLVGCLSSEQAHALSQLIDSELTHLTDNKRIAEGLARDIQAQYDPTTPEYTAAAQKYETARDAYIRAFSRLIDGQPPQPDELAAADKLARGFVVSAAATLGRKLTSDEGSRAVVVPEELSQHVGKVPKGLRGYWVKRVDVETTWSNWPSLAQGN